MTFTEFLAIVSGLAIGYWLVAVFIPNARKPRKEEAEAAAARDEAPGWGRPPEQPAAWHETPGVDGDASHEEIVAAYRRLIAHYHPDRDDARKRVWSGKREAVRIERGGRS